MALYALVGFDRAPHQMALRDQLRLEHRSYVLEHSAIIRLAGATIDNDGNQNGSLLVLDAECEYDVWQWIEKEPFYRAGVYETMEIRKWDLVMGEIAADF